MSQRVLVTFIDAFGPHQLEALGEHFDFLPHRRVLSGTMGYSSGALPTILTGASPAVHGRMCLFSAPERARSGVLSPLTWLGLLPRLLHERTRVRALAARILARTQGLTGYVALHRIPPEAFRWLDIPERDDLFRADEIGGVPTFLADARSAGLDVYAAPWQLPENERWAHAHAALAARQPRLSFLYAGALDGALHQHGNQRTTIAQVGGHIADHIAKARKLLGAGLEGGTGGVLTLVVGDHGMADVDRVIDPRPALEQLSSERVFVDSTMIRFWGRDLERYRAAVERLRAPGIWLEGADLHTREVPTDGSPYGDAIFILGEGALFAPSFLGGRVRGMHGYDLSSPSANAALASDHEIPPQVGSTAAVADHIRKALGLPARGGASERGTSSEEQVKGIQTEVQ